VGKSYRDIDFVDRDEQLHGDFFTNAEAIDVANIPSSELDTSDEEQSEQLVEVRFDGDGFVEEVANDDTDGPKPRRIKEAVSEPLELMPQPHELGVTQAGQDFAEVISRVAEFYEVSKLNTCRWEHHGTGKKISCKASVVDYLADVQIVARRVLSPELYKLFREVYFENYGNEADGLSLTARLKIQQRCSAGWKLAGLIPFADYWHHPTPENKIGVAVGLLQRIEEKLCRENESAFRKARRKTLRTARSKRAPKITRLTVAA